MELHRSKTRSIREFENWAHSYDHSILNSLVFEPSYKLMFGEVCKRAKRKSTFRMLDIGCGTGTFLAKCLASGLDMEVTGLDIAYNMIRQATYKAKRIISNGSAMTFMVGDAEHLPFESGYFDMVTCSNSFHHYPNQLQAVREMKRVLKSNGELLIVDGHRDDPLGYLIFDVAVDAVEKHVHHCSRRQFIKMFKEAGFQKVTQRMAGLYIPLLATQGQA
ncbi:MAG: methyltransferase domain-containing protein [Phycisphaerae bacterium]|nr:methyltransferase domain-containing protein [Phycisphaerae bacterium]